MSDATERYELLLHLSPSQSLALEVLDRGGTHAEAAESASVDRTTVARWATRHPAFVAEMSRRRLDRARSNERRLAEIDQQATEAIAREIESGNADLALRWCKLRGFTGMVATSDQPTDPVAYIKGRAKSLPTDFESLVDRMDGRDPKRAVNAIWVDLEGSVELGVMTPEAWRDELLATEPEHLGQMYDDEFEELIANVDLNDPEVSAHLVSLGIDPTDPKLPDESVSPTDGPG